MRINKTTNLVYFLQVSLSIKRLIKSASALEQYGLMVPYL